MTRTAQKKDELAFLNEFLRNQLKLKVVELQPALKEPPDGCASRISEDGSTLLFDFEIVEYYVDDPRDRKGGSPSMRTKGIWDKVQAKVVPRLLALRLPILIDVRLKEPINLSTRHICPIADEMIRFASEYCPQRPGERKHHEVFSVRSYPFFCEWVQWISLTRLDDTFGINPHCSNLASAFIGLVPGHLRDHIPLKSDRPFNWRPVPGNVFSFMPLGV